MITQIEEFLQTKSLDKSNYTLRSYRDSINRFVSYFEILKFEDIAKITTSDCRQYITFLVGTGLKKSSVNAFIRPLKVMFNFFVENEYLQINPFDKIRFLKTEKRIMPYLSEQEVDMILKACETIEETLIIAMLVSLGLRRSELVNLKVSDITDNCVSVWGKGSKNRKVFFPLDVFELYQEYLTTRKDKSFPYVFRSKMNRPYTPESIRLKIKAISQRAGIDAERIADISPHCFRRTFATNMVENGTDIRVIQGALGHSSINTTMKYANLRNSAVAKAMENQRPILA